MKQKQVSQQTFDEIKHTGHGVPRTATRYVQEGFKVSSEYLIKTAESDETLKVRCTQDCPIHLKVID